MSVPARIKQVMSSNSMNLKEFSDAIGISYRTVQNYLSGERGVGSEFLTALSERLGVSATWILTGMGAQRLDGQPSDGDFTSSKFIPITRFAVEASAGHGSLVQDETGSGTYAYNKAFLDRRSLKPADLAVIAVKGDSMAPDIHDGDLILVNRAEADPDNLREGAIYVVHYDNGLYVKRIQRAPGRRLMLASSNPAYPPITVDDADAASVQLIGRVVNSTHEW